MSRVSQLYELQEVDSGMESRVARMRQIDVQMVDSPEVIAAKSMHDEAVSLLAIAQAYLKQISHETEEVSTRLRTQEKRLYDGKIKNPKELSQVQEEVTHLRNRLKDDEEAVLQAMMNAEEVEAVAGARRDELENLCKELEQYQAGLSEEKDKLLSQAKVLQVKRQKMVTELSPSDLQAYERLRRGKAGVAVAPVRGGLCGGCHVAVPANILRAARAGNDFVHCPSCGRILYPIGEVRFEEFNHDLDNIGR